MSSIEAIGTIKVKNGKGKLVPFMPSTDASYVADFSGTSLSTKLQRLDAKLNDSQTPEAFYIVNSEPTEETTSSYAPETLIAWYKGLETDGMKHLTVQASNSSVGKVLKVGDEVTFTYTIINDGGE